MLHNVVVIDEAYPARERERERERGERKGGREEGRGEEGRDRGREGERACSLGISGPHCILTLKLNESLCLIEEHEITTQVMT